MYDLPELDEGDDDAVPLVPAVPLLLALPIVALFSTNFPPVALAEVEPDVPVAVALLLLVLSARQPTTVIESLLAVLGVCGLGVLVCAVATTQPRATAKAVAVHV